MEYKCILKEIHYLKDFLYVAEHEDHHQVLFLLWESLAVEDGPGERPLHCQSVLNLQVKQQILYITLQNKNT